MNNENVKSTAIAVVQNPTGEIAAALAKAQAAFTPIVFDAKVKVATKSGSSYEFEYATFANILASTRKALTDNELALVQTSDDDVLITRLLHSSGQQIESRVTLPINESMSSQDIGGVRTYFKRYEFSAIIGVAAEADDDANGSAGNQYEQQPVGKGTPVNSVPTSPAPRPPAKPVAKLSAIPAPTQAPAPVVAKVPLNEPLTPQTAAAILAATYEAHNNEATEVTESAPVNYPYKHPERGPIDSTSVANIIRGFAKVGISQAEIEKYANYPIMEWDEGMKKLALADYKGLVAKAWTKEELLSGNLIQQ